MRVYQIVKRVTAAVGSVVNSRTNVSVGRALSTVADLGRTRVSVGREITPAPFRGTQALDRGLSVSPLVSGTGMGSAALGRALTTRADGLLGSAAKGVEVIQTKVDLTHRSGAATQTNVGPNGNWTNPANAQGVRDGSSATAVGQALAATDARLRGVFAAFVGKGSLAITQVTLTYYYAQAGTVSGNGRLQAYWTINGTDGIVGAQSGANRTGNFDFLAAGETFDITALIAGSWATLANLRALVAFRPPSGAATVTATLDAVEITVVATRTDAQ